MEDPLSGKKSCHISYFKMKVLGDVTRESVKEFVKESVDYKVGLFTDKKAAYVNL